MLKKILCIVIDNKLQFIVKTKRAGFKVQKINGDNYIEIDQYLGRFDDFRAIWENFCEQVGIYEDVVISSVLVVDSKLKNLIELSEYILNRLINTHNKVISSNSKIEWTNSELEEILTTIKDSILKDITISDVSISNNDIPLNILTSSNTLIINADKNHSETKSVDIKVDTNELLDMNKNSKKENSNIAINHVECYLDNYKNAVEEDAPTDFMLSSKSILDSISEKEELKYLKEKTKNFNHKVRSPR
ncbi:MAG: hypothetical protein KH115_00050 [Veillonella sp.]|uniref:hypothetical protein n=1 Tax=Veillonella sp. TaxID=1926307 RepID=UPI001DF3CE67|nr:hypothetical protein [Veillonella sp.]MBS7013710.1 hypothetical protein [Veillonella sp.]